jgi:hypothetical protein
VTAGFPMPHPMEIQVPPQQGAPAPDAGGGGGDPFQEIIEAARRAVEADGTVDAQERLIIEQITTLVAKLQANREKQEQAALGGGPATQFLRRSSGA